MNPEDIKIIVDMLSKYYVWEVLIMGAAIGLTMILKLPIKKKAVKLEKKYGVDKSMLTWITALIPYVLCFGMVFILFWYRSDWALTVDWALIAKEAALLGSGAIGIYEAIKKLIKGAIAIHEKKELNKEEAVSQSSASKYRIQKGDK